MVSKRISTVENGKAVQIESENEELDFLSVRVGASKLKLSQLNADTLTTNGKKVRALDGTDLADVSTFGQLSAEVTNRGAAISGLQGQIDTAGIPTVTNFDVGIGGQSQFIIGTITSQTYIEVLVNGKELREGVTDDYQRNVANSRIDMNYTVPQNAWVRVKVFS